MGVELNPVISRKMSAGEKPLAIGIDIGGSKINCGLVREDGKIIWSKKIPTPKGYKNVLRVITSLIKQGLSEGMPPRGCLKGIGVAIAALVDHEAGIVVLSTHLGWRKAPIVQDLRETLSSFIVLENDAYSSALAELRFGRGRVVQDFIFLSLGTSIGCGLILEGKLYRGSKGIAGGLTHVIVDTNGPPCTCGQRGCLETYISSWALKERVIRYLESGNQSKILEKVHGELRSVSPLEIAEAAREGDSFAKEVVSEFLEYLSIGVANIVSLFNPSLIIVGGGLVGMVEMLPKILEQRVKERVLPPFRDSFRIVETSIGDAHGILGGAAAVSMGYDEMRS